MPELDIVGRLKKLDRKQLLLLGLIFVLAFGVRGHLLKYDYMFGFDGYYHARMVGTLLETGSLPEKDPMSYYFKGGGDLPQNKLFWYFTAAIYKISTLGGGYDKDLWIVFVKVLPALFGALISVAMFFLGKAMYNKKAGYVMGFMAAIVPSFVYRTLAGFFEEDSLGFLWLVIGMVFFVRAVKNPVFNRQGIINATVAGFFFGVMALTWDMFLLIPLVMGLYLVFALMHVYTKMSFKEFLDFIKLYVLTFVIFALMATLSYGIGWIERARSYAMESVLKALASFSGSMETAWIMLLIAGLLFVGAMVFLAYKGEKKTINLISVMVLYMIVVGLAYVFLSIPVLFQEDSVLGKSVGEENTGKQYFGIKYNALIAFPVIALLLIPIRLYRNKRDHLSAMIFFWIVITYFMAWYKLKFTYTFGLPIAAAAGVIAAEIFYYMKSRTSLERAIVAGCLGFMLITGVASATIFVPDKVPHIEMPNPDWKQALVWMQNPENIPADAKFFNWWDEGHWISFMGEKAVSADNRNLSWESDQDFALFVITSDVQEAVGIAKKYDFDYVLLASDMFLKVGSFGNYAYDTTNSGDPRIIKFLIAPHNSMPCSAQAPTPQGTGYSCGGNTFPPGQIETLPWEWTPTSNQMFTSEQGLTVPLYIYRAADNSEIYIVNPALNESMMAMLWFHKPEAMQYFEEVYGKEGIRLFRFKKEAA